MNRMQWKEEYLIQIPRIDFQHQYFLELINWLGENLQLNKDITMRKRYLTELAQYAKFHFISEENFMYAIRYKEVERHKELHEELVEQLTVHIVRVELKDEDIPDLLRFLTEWFINHTTSEDKKITRHLEGTGATSG